MFNLSRKKRNHQQQAETPPKERIPKGVTYNLGGGSYPVSATGGVEAGKHHVSTFEVVPKHAELPGGIGVKFNAETVPDALEEHLQKATISRKELVQSIQESLAAKYTSESDRKGANGYRSDGTLSPVLGWYVAHSPPKSKSVQLEEAKKEVSDLLLGHKEEAAAADLDETAPWYVRVSFLKKKIQELEGNGSEAGP